MFVILTFKTLRSDMVVVYGFNNRVDFGQEILSSVLVLE